MPPLLKAKIFKGGAFLKIGNSAILSRVCYLILGFCLDNSVHFYFLETFFLKANLYFKCNISIFSPAALLVHLKRFNFPKTRNENVDYLKIVGGKKLKVSKTSKNEFSKKSKISTEINPTCCEFLFSPFKSDISGRYQKFST